MMSFRAITTGPFYRTFVEWSTWSVNILGSTSDVTSFREALAVQQHDILVLWVRKKPLTYHITLACSNHVLVTLGVFFAAAVVLVTVLSNFATPLARLTPNGRSTRAVKSVESDAHSQCDVPQSAARVYEISISRGLLAIGGTFFWFAYANVLIVIALKQRMRYTYAYVVTTVLYERRTR